MSPALGHSFWGLWSRNHALDAIRMWQTFLPDLLVTFIGAVLTVAIAFCTYLLNERRREKASLSALVGELHHRRALSLIENPMTVPDAEVLDDFVRANASILSVRDEIRRTRDIVKSSAALQEVLASMTRACNRYLESAAAEPDQYWYLLDDLRRHLADDVHRLVTLRPRVRALEPGSGAF
jgi:hypothetical protein